MRSLNRDEDPDERFYPDLLAAGSLADLLRQFLSSDGLRIGDDLGRWSAVVTGDLADRDDFRVYISADERAFGVAGWSRGVMLINGDTDDLAEVCAAVRAWHAGAALAEIGARCSFLPISGLALAHERGPAAAVAWNWKLLRESWQGDEHAACVVELIEAAFAVPELRQLYAYTSHFDLRFSTCTGFPFSRDVPHISPRDEGFVVCHPGGKPIGVTDNARQAVALLVRHLPPDLGPAVAGTETW
jgi:hypothetical protein